MKNIVWITGIIMLLWGMVILLQPAIAKKMLGFFTKGRWIYCIASLKLVVGIFFLIYATSCKYPWIIIALGLLMAGGSLAFMAIPFGKIQPFMEWYQKRPLWFLRVCAIFALLLGAITIYTGIPK